MGPGNESHFFAPTVLGLADVFGATNSETAHPEQKHQASTVTEVRLRKPGAPCACACACNLTRGLFAGLSSPSVLSVARWLSDRFDVGAACKGLGLVNANAHAP